jgi:hypothetical protein
MLWLVASCDQRQGQTRSPQSDWTAPDGMGGISRPRIGPALRGMIEEGFPEGDDAFDTLAGLFGMVEVALGRRKYGEPSEDRIRNVEGWILGQRSITKAESHKSRL